MTQKNRKKSRNFMFLSTGCSLLRAEGFCCSLGFLYGGLGISKQQFLIKKIKIKFSAINFLSILGHQTLDPDPESAIRIRNKKKCRIRIRIRIKSMRIRNPGRRYHTTKIRLTVHSFMLTRGHFALFQTKVVPYL